MREPGEQGERVAGPEDWEGEDQGPRWLRHHKTVYSSRRSKP